MSKSTNQSLRVNRREYALPSTPAAVLCLSGASSEYLDAALVRGKMPNLEKMIRQGFRGEARTALPSSSLVNQVSLVTGTTPAVHGIVGQFIFDASRQQEIMLNRPKQLRAETILAAAARAGKKPMILTADPSLREILAAGMEGTENTATTEPISPGHLPTLPEPGSESINIEAEVSVFETGARLLKDRKTDFLYASSRDVLFHSHGPASDPTLAFLSAVDGVLGELLQTKVLLGLVADHGMTPKVSLDGKPNVLYLESGLTRQFGLGPRVSLPNLAPSMPIAQQLGSCAVVHLPSLQPPDPVIQWLMEQPGVSEVYDRRTAATKLELPPDRLGELVVFAARNAVLARTPEIHPMESIPPAQGFYSHGGRYEALVPLILSRGLTPEYAVRAQADLRVFDLFDLLLNGVAA